MLALERPVAKIEFKIREGIVVNRKNLTPFADAVTRRDVVFGGAVAFGGFAMGAIRAWAAGQEEISHTGEAIHQEVVFKAGRKRVYEALTNANQFDKVVRLSAAMQSGMAPGAKPTELSREAGGPFSLFGGYITGRHIELLPDERIVQAWRAASWDPGTYSIAKFVLVEQDSGTKLVFDHRGFPEGQAQHLAQGWKVNYWEPLEKFLA